MARVNITVPDEVLIRARKEGLTISQIATRALEDELERRDKIVSVHEYLAELERELGPISPEDAARAQRQLDAAFRRSATMRRSA